MNTINPRPPSGETCPPKEEGRPDASGRGEGLTWCGEPVLSAAKPQVEGPAARGDLSAEGGEPSLSASLGLGEDTKGSPRRVGAG
jgi:hypothetical protein